MDAQPAANGGKPVSGTPVSGTPTFLFSDIEGSTRLLQQLGERYATLLDEHRALITTTVEAAGGRIFGTEGDAVFCAFPTAAAALKAAAAAQRALAGYDWPEDGRIHVRMGVHSGEATLTRDDYVGLAVHQVARIMSAGHGGQVLVSEATRRLANPLPEGLELRDLGERRLKDLAAPERIYQLVGDGLEERFPPLRTLDARQNNLPHQVTSFVGRAELAAAREALAQTRLLSLTGPGGTGKTRLAVQLAADVSDEFDDGVFFVPLDSISDAEIVSSEIVAVLGLSVGGKTAPLDAAIEYLRDKRVLLVLDNFEQIVAAARDVGRMLHEAPNIKILVTTRIVLHVYGEHEFPVPPLGLPPAGTGRLTAEDAMRHEAVELFVDRARAVQPQFTLTDENAPLVVDIVRRLDGLPLAIELAAARTRALPVAAIHSRLDQHLALLTGGSRDLPGRQQTLRSAIDWSYDLLEPPDQRLFERFSIHSGGAFLTQADTVCGPAKELGEDVLDGLSSLADKSLVRPDLAAAEDPRFTMLVTIRDYAHERLEGAPDFAELARRHAHVYLELAEQLERELNGPNGRAMSDRLEQDHDNIRAALDWCIATGNAEWALRFIAAVWRFWQVRGHLAEARRRVEAVVAMAGIDAMPAELRARGLAAAGGVAYWQGDVRATHRWYGQALEAARQSGDDRMIAEALYNYGFAASDQDRTDSQLYGAGRQSWEEALALYRTIGDDRGIADASWGIAMAVASTGDVEAAIAFGEEALAGYRRVGDPFRVGWGLFLLAGLRAGRSELDQADAYLREALEIFRRVNDRAGMLLTLTGHQYLANQAGQRVRSLRLGGAIDALRKATGAALVDSPVEIVDFVLPERPTDDPAAEHEWEAGSRMSAEEAAAYALDNVDVDKTELSPG